MPNSPYLSSTMTNCKSFLEFKSTHPMGIIFDGIRFGWIFSLLKDLFHNVFPVWVAIQDLDHANKELLIHICNEEDEGKKWRSELSL